MSARSSTLSPVTVPSFSADRVSFCHWSRPWWAESNDSDRVSVYLTGLPSRRDTAMVTYSSGVVCSLPPKPPPTSGAMTRTLDSEMPIVAEMRNRRMWGTCVADQTVICSWVGSTTTDLGSMKAGMRRCCRYSRSMTMPSVRALAMASSTLPPEPCSAESSFQKALLLVPRSGWASTVSAAASLRSSAAGRTS